MVLRGIALTFAMYCGVRRVLVWEQNGYNLTKLDFIGED